MALTDGLISFWSLNGNAEDDVGSNDGTVDGATSTASGKLGGAYEFDGSNDYINVGNSSTLRISGSCSIAAWVNINAAMGGGQKFIFAQASEWTNGFQLRLFDGLPNMMVYSGGTTYNCRGTTDVRGDGWVYVVGTYNHTTSTEVIYLNATAEATSTSVPAPASISDKNFWIGRRDGTNVILGVIDEVGFWNRALSSTEVSELYNSGAGLAYPFTTGYGKKIFSIAAASVNKINNISKTSVAKVCGV